jgi:hypothetical protein
MKAKPDFKFGDRVVFIGDRPKRGVVSRVFQSGGVWHLRASPTGATSRGTSGEWHRTTPLSRRMPRGPRLDPLPSAFAAIAIVDLHWER